MKQQKERQHSLTTENLPKKTKQGVAPIAQVVIDDVLYNVYNYEVLPTEDGTYLRDYSTGLNTSEFVDTFCKFEDNTWYAWNHNINKARKETMVSTHISNWAIPASKDTIEDFSESEKDFININEDAAKIVLHSKEFVKGNDKEEVQSMFESKFPEYKAFSYNEVKVSTEYVVL